MYNCHAAFRAKPGLAGITGIEIENPIDHLGETLMGMPKDHGLRSLGLNEVLEGIGQRQGVNDMLNEKFFLRQQDRFRKAIPEFIIAISEHGGYRRDELQFQYNRGVTDVARVEDMVHPGENFFNAWVQKTMRVRNDSDFHRNGLNSMGQRDLPEGAGRQGPHHSANKGRLAQLLPSFSG